MTVSTLSKKHKSPAWKERKRQKHTENMALRASLHREKAQYRNGGALDVLKRAEVQARIDAISNNS